MIRKLRTWLTHRFAFPQSRSQYPGSPGLEMPGAASVSGLKESTKEQHLLSVYPTSANNIAQDTVGPKSTQISAQSGDKLSGR